MEPPDFVYDELPDANEYIRLLKILDARKGNTVQCSIFSCPKVAAPKYIAISYTWGHPTSTASIRLNGKRAVVRQNCRDVLRQAYAHDADQYYWVDALCINQKNLEEKSDQVATMGSTYANAIRVLACVGPTFSDSGFFFDFLNHQAKMLTSAGQSTKGGFFHLSAASYNQLRSLGAISGRRLQMSVDMWLFSVKEHTFRRIGKCLSYLLGREYFSRVWIVQEMFMASQVIICCGQHAVPVDVLIGLVGTLKRGFSSLASGRISTRPLKGLLNDAFWGDIKRVEEVLLSGPAIAILRFASISNEHRFEADPLLDLMSKLGCEDPRDRIFGALSLVDWKGSPPFRPDYTKSNWEVAFDLLRLFPNRNSHHRHDARLGYGRVSNPLIMADKLVECFGSGLPEEVFLPHAHNECSKAYQLCQLPRNMRVDDPVGCFSFVPFPIGSDEPNSCHSANGSVFTVKTTSREYDSVMNPMSGRNHLNGCVHSASIYTRDSPKAWAKVNSQVRAGDWLLHGGRFSFVAREASLNELHLVSYAVRMPGVGSEDTIPQYLRSLPSLPSATIWMDPQDLMKYAVLLHNYKDKLEQEDQVDEIFDAVFTDPPARLYKSSFAVFRSNVR